MMQPNQSRDAGQKIYLQVAGGYLSNATMVTRAANALIPPTTKIIIPITITVSLGELDAI